MATTPLKSSSQKDSTTFTIRLERFSTLLELIRKVLINIFLAVSVVVLSVFIIKTSNQKRLLISTFEIPDDLKKQGYTGEALTGMVLEKIKYIRLDGTEYYKNNDIILSNATNQIDIINNSLANTPLAEIKFLIGSLINIKLKRASGQIIKSQEQFELMFGIDGESAINSKGNSLDSLISAAAEYIMKVADPYYLGAYYFETNQTEKCLKLMQHLLNDDKEENKYLAMHIRGNVYIRTGNYDLARKILNEAVAIRNTKSSWLTYNSIGAIYQDKEQFDSAKLWYKKSIASFRKGYFAHYNFGNVLLQENQVEENTQKLDSALYYFKEASKLNKGNIDPYIGILKVYAQMGKLQEANEYFYKCTEMEPGNAVIYAQMFILAERYGDTNLAKRYLHIIDSLDRHVLLQK